MTRRPSDAHLAAIVAAVFVVGWCCTAVALWWAGVQ